MWKTTKEQDQEHAYEDKSKAYWENLYQAVLQEINGYNAGQPPEAQLSVVDCLNAKEFMVQHNQRAQSPTQVSRIFEKQPHVIQIVCYVAQDGPHDLELRLDADGNAEAYNNKARKNQTVEEVVTSIVRPLKKLGCVRSHEADQSTSEPPDYGCL